MITRYLMLLSVIYFALIGQLGLQTSGLAIQYCPWLPGMALAACALCGPGAGGLICSAILGLGVDCLTGTELGLNAAIATITAFSLMAARNPGATIGIAGCGLSVFFAGSLWRGGSEVLDLLLMDHHITASHWIGTVFLEPMTTAVIATALIMFWRLFRSVGRPQKGRVVELTNRWSMLIGR